MMKMYQHYRPEKWHHQLTPPTSTPVTNWFISKMITQQLALPVPKISFPHSTKNLLFQWIAIYYGWYIHVTKNNRNQPSPSLTYSNLNKITNIGAADLWPKMMSNMYRNTRCERAWKVKELNGTGKKWLMMETKLTSLCSMLNGELLCSWWNAVVAG